MRIYSLWRRQGVKGMRRLCLLERKVYRMAFRYALRDAEGLMVFRQFLEDRLLAFPRYELERMVMEIEDVWASDFAVEAVDDWLFAEQSWLHTMLAVEIAARQED